MTNLFKVDGQTLTPIEIYPAVSDTVNYLTFAFMFSFDWAGLTKSAIFTKGDDEYEVVLTDDEVLESDHVNLTAGTWSISVVGDTVVDAVVTRQITTSSYDYTVTQSGATSGGAFPPYVASQVYVNVNQATPQTLVGGILKLAADRVIVQDNEIVDKKHVDDTVAAVTADDFNHNDLASKQGGTEDEYYHVTAAEKTIIENTSGTNTGDQDVSGAISTHNTDAGAHASLARENTTMRLLISRTIGAGENVSAITWTQDDAGNALALIDAEIRSAIPSPVSGLNDGTNINIYGRLNDVASGYFFVGSVFECAVAKNRGGVSNCSIKKISATKYSIGTLSSGIDSLSSTINVSRANGNLNIGSAIAKIYVYINSAGLTYFPEGTTIEIYGRTA